jgi:hypothetical protein
MLKEILIAILGILGAAFIGWIVTAAIKSLLNDLGNKISILVAEFGEMKGKMDNLVTVPACEKNHQMEAVEREAHRKDTERHEEDIKEINERLRDAGV